MATPIEMVRPSDVYVTDSGEFQVVGADLLEQYRAGRDPVCRVRLLLQGGSILTHRFGEPVNVYRPN